MTEKISEIIYVDNGKIRSRGMPYYGKISLIANASAKLIIISVTFS